MADPGAGRRISARRPGQTDSLPRLLYKILTAQEANAPGGAYDYIVRGKMIGGCGMVAYPAQYGVIGIMTFIVNHDGVVYEKVKYPAAA